ncbi:MAG: NAD(P)H-quinone oxidoreductase [Pseudomonadota bacterium]|nr:NAD(P)H-quinone oxidoreductase [Pseudomonadota bacterium]MEC8061802.1 NAD(P)H-quinone oxidoreductase [Pseudomonadota bacterium]MEC8118103.1 NAD(P)H-quinone oxidoreductase [Pseudomonadota bacterium]MEC8317096.1 NAD(P)H-quinone oxidoreductase [Pseudomonadota bacterium]
MADIPVTMTAVEITEFGPPDGLRPCRRDTPVPEAGEVLIEVAYAGVNRPDVIQRQGFYPPPPGASDLPGLEVAGTVVAVAGDVTDWRVGDRCCALVNGGGYAEYCTAPAGQCLPIPDGYDLRRAAALPETFFTVWSNVFERGQLKAGESLLVHGGSSGIGSTAIQLAAARGATVYVTAGSAEKCRFCEDLGAHRAINYRDEDFAAVMKEVGGVDVVLDMVGGDYAQKNINSLRPDGRLVIIGFLGGPKTADFNFTKIMTQRLTVTGSTLRPRSAADKAAIATTLADQVWPLLADGAIAPVIAQVFDLDQAAEAHRLMESSTHMGKILLKVA